MRNPFKFKIEMEVAALSAQLHAEQKARRNESEQMQQLKMQLERVDDLYKERIAELQKQVDWFATRAGGRPIYSEFVSKKPETESPAPAKISARQGVAMMTQLYYQEALDKQKAEIDKQNAAMAEKAKMAASVVREGKSS